MTAIFAENGQKERINVINLSTYRKESEAVITHRRNGSRKIEDILEQTKGSLIISDVFTKADSVLNHKGYKNIACSVSGGADSDILVDICEKIKPHGVHYVWFDTGIEYQATKEHLKYLEKHYGITVERERAVKPVPLSNKLYGQPFLSKYVSQMIHRLQEHNFDWRDESYEVAVQKYPNCKCALKWFNNMHSDKEYSYSRFNISGQKYLREFLIAHPPTFPISDKCCTGAKKDVSKKYIKEHDIDLMLVGIRKAEGGVRTGAYKNCFSNEGKYKTTNQYRPIFWFSDADRKEYEELFNIKHSKCYTEYGFKRTGCACCPYGRDFDDELKVLEQHEPNLCKAVKNIFHDSYEYTRQYRAFRKEMEEANEVKKL